MLREYELALSCGAKMGVRELGEGRGWSPAWVMPSHQQRSPGGSDDSYQGLVDLRFVAQTNNREAKNYSIVNCPNPGP